MIAGLPHYFKHNRRLPPDDLGHKFEDSSKCIHCGFDVSGYYSGPYICLSIMPLADELVEHNWPDMIVVKYPKGRDHPCLFTKGPFCSLNKAYMLCEICFRRKYFE